MAEAQSAQILHSYDKLPRGHLGHHPSVLIGTATLVPPATEPPPHEAVEARLSGGKLEAQPVSYVSYTSSAQHPRAASTARVPPHLQMCQHTACSTPVPQYSPRAPG